MDAILSALGLGKSFTIGGFLGALVSLRFMSELTTYWQRFVVLFCGWILAAATTPIVLAVMGMDKVSERQELGAAFLVGAFGMSLSAAFVVAIPEFMKAVRERISK